MKKNGLILPFLACALVLTGACKKNNDDELGHHHHNHSHQHEAHAAEGHEHHDGEHEHEGAAEKAHAGEIVLAPAVAERFGVQVDTLAPADFHEVIAAAGSVMTSSDNIAVISAPASGTVTLRPGINVGAEVSSGMTVASIDTRSTSGGDANMTAKAALDAAKRELDRLTPLYEEKLVTASEYNSARAAYDSAVAAYSVGASSGVARTPISGVITALDVASGQYVAAGSPLATVASSSTLTLRIDVPRRYASSVASLGAGRIRLAGAGLSVDMAELGAKRIASSSMPSSSAGSYIPVYYSVRNDGSVLPGASFEAFLEGSLIRGALVVPVTALSEQQGEYYVYRRLDEDCYEKVRVTLGADNGAEVVLRSGVVPGDVIVVKGTTSVRLAETSGVAPEGHTHNH